MIGNASENNDALAAAARRAFQTPFGALMCLTPDNGGPVYVDGRGDAVVICDDIVGVQSDAFVFGQRDTLARIIGGERGFENAFLSGRITLAGDMSVFSRLKIENPR